MGTHSVKQLRFNMEEKIFIGRTNAYYEPNEDSLYVEDTWTWSEDSDDRGFASEVYELNDEAKSELEWWLESQRMNLWQRNHSFNPDCRSSEEVWESLIQNAVLIN